jgi:hypothetical protein
MVQLIEIKSDFPFSELTYVALGKGDESIEGLVLGAGRKKLLVLLVHLRSLQK